MEKAEKKDLIISKSSNCFGVLVKVFPLNLQEHLQHGCFLLAIKIFKIIYKPPEGTVGGAVGGTTGVSTTAFGGWILQALWRTTSSSIAISLDHPGPTTPSIIIWKLVKICCASSFTRQKYWLSKKTVLLTELISMFWGLTLPSLLSSICLLIPLSL